MQVKLAKPASFLTTRRARSVATAFQPAHKLSSCLAKRSRNESTFASVTPSSELTAERSLQPPGAGTALEQLLHGRDVALLWDLDNVSFFAPSSSAMLQLHRMRALIELSGGRLATCRGYFNQQTARRLSGVLPLLERTGLMTCHVLPVRRDAADMGLVRDALMFVNVCQDVGSSSSSALSAPSSLLSASLPSSSPSMAGVLASGLSSYGPDAEAKEEGRVVWCVSQDAGFATPLRHLSERGVRTVAVSPHTPGRKVHAAMYPATYFAKLPLPAACWAALKWEPTGSPVTAAEATWLRELLVLTGDTDRHRAEVRQTVPAPRGLAFYGKEGVSCPGSFTTLWLNHRYCR